jgi:PAS domain S-box-containing protein
MLQEKRKKYNYIFGLACVLWTALIAFSAFRNAVFFDETVFSNAKSEAEASYNKDIFYRRWVTMQGGVYVYPSENTPPNPYLDRIKDRDIETTTGKKLTLVNPAYMTRQVHELAGDSFGVKSHITSLNPLNPINKPDKWEIEALLDFEKGASEKCTLEKEKGITVMRFMRPMTTEAGCLKCHEWQGYKVGDVRGGISVSVSMEKYIITSKAGKREMFIIHSGIYLAGLFVLFMFFRFAKENLGEKELLKRRLNEKEEELAGQRSILESIFENSPYIMILVDEEARIININRQGLDLAGKAKEETEDQLAGFVLNCVNSFKEPGCGKHPECFTCPIRNLINDIFATGEPVHYKEASMAFNHNGQRAVYDFLISTSLVKRENKKQALITIADVTAQKRTEQIINESKNKFESIFDFAPYAIILTDVKDSYYVDANKAFETLFGYQKSEIIGSQVNALNFWSSLEDRKDLVTRLMQKGEVINAEYTLTGKNDKTLEGQICSKIIELNEREIFLTIIQDITERKQSEQRLIEFEEKMLFFTKNNPLAFVEWDSEFKVKAWNYAAEQMFGYTEEEAIGKEGYFFVPGEEKMNISQVWKDIAAKGEGRRSVNPNIRKDGEVILCDWYNTKLIDSSGKMSSIISLAKEVTEEFKIREELQESRNMVQNILNSIPLAIFWKDKNDNYLGCNRKFAQITGAADTGEITGKRNEQIVQDENLARLLGTNDSEVIKTGEPIFDIKASFTDSKGAPVWINMTKLPLLDLSGGVTGTIGVYEDITQKRDNELRQKMFIETINASFNEFFIFDAVTLQFEFVSKGALQNLGYSILSMRAMTPVDIKPDYTRERFLELLSPLYEGKESIIHFHTRQQRADGSIYPVEVHLQLFNYYERKVFLAVVIDETESIKAQENLIKSEERFFKIFQANPAAIIITRTSDNTIVDVNAAFTNMFGYSGQEAIGRDTFSLGLYTDINDYFELVKHLREQKKIPSLEFKLKGKNKNTIYALISNEMAEINGEQCVISIVTNISDRISAEEKNRLSEEKYRTLFETMEQGVIYQDSEGKIFNANKAAERILGLTFDQMQGRKMSDTSWKAINEDGTDFPAAKHPIKIALSKGISVTNVTMGVLNPKEKRIRWIVINTTPQFKGGEELPYLVYSTFTDITERKIAEEALKESESKFSSIFHISPICIAIVRMKDGRFIEVNKSWHNIIGYSENDTLERNIDELDLWVDNSEKNIYYENLRELGALHGYESKIKRKDGSALDMLINAECIELMGEQCILNVAQDITNRKLMEEALRESEERYKSLFNLSPDAIFVHQNGEIIMANQAARIMINGSPDIELKGRNVIDLVAPEYRNTVMDRIRRMRDKNVLVHPLNEKFLRADGVTIDVEVAGAPCIIDGEKSFQVFARDITERIKTEKALNENREKIIAILKAIPDMMFIISRDGVIIDYKPAWSGFKYAESSEFLNKKISDVLPSEIAKLTLQKIDAIKEDGKMQTYEFNENAEGDKFYESRLVPCGSESFLAIVRDITKSKHDEVELKKSLSEKDILLRELYHRTKNNMQVISAMLQLQTLSTSDADMVKILIETSNRIKTMALVHQKLYQSKDLSNINLKEYIADLISLLKNLYSINDEKIKITLDLEEQYILIDYAVPCGLIINEIVSNTFKYAFPGDMTGNLIIGLSRDDNGIITLTFKDDGIGLPEEFNENSGTTLGMQLINSLVSHQLDGTIEITRGQGVEIKISFIDNQYGIRI